MKESKTVLCVEDDADIRDLLRIILDEKEFQVLTCAESRKSLRLTKKYKFSAIVLDQRLDDISGIEICREIRSYDKQIPIIFYTAASSPQEKTAGLAAGADLYLIKPNDFDKIADSIRYLVSMKAEEKVSVSNTLYQSET